MDQRALGNALKPPPAPQDEAKARLLAAALVGLIALTYAWAVTCGRMRPWPTRTAYYSLLADAFLHGQLDLLIRPDPRLLATPDPYDPRYNSPYRLQDGALYRGKYYIYWGPFPAVLMTPLRWLGLGGSAPVGDQFVNYPFTLGLVAISALLVLRARRRFFPDQPWWTVAFGILTAGLANPVPFLLTSASVYPTAIVTGQFFLLAGLYCAWCGLDEWAARPAAAGGNRRGRAWLAAAGACGAAAVGCRISLVPAVAALASAVLLRLVPTRSPNRSGEPRPKRPTWGAAVGAAACIFLPLLGGAALFAAYNRARFGDPLEFGVRYVLAGQNVHRMVAEGRVASTGNVPVNLIRYLLEPPTLEPGFPFLSGYGSRLWSDLGIYVHKDFIVDCVAGMVWVAPVFALAILPIWMCLREAGRRALRAASRSPPVVGEREGDEARGRVGIRWLTTVLAALAVLGFLPSLTMAASAMRYLGDVMPPLAILVALGGWIALSRQKGDQRGHRARVITALVLLTAWSALAGVALGVAERYLHVAPSLLAR